MASTVEAADRRAVLATMLRMRRFEEAVFGLWTDKHFTGHYHLYIGQEATGAAALGALGADDPVYSTHRNHGHLIARGADPGRALAEILGREGGLLGGRGGTLHLADPARGVPHTSALVGGCTALACGAAHAIRSFGERRVAAVFFGDGALEEGVSFEAMNIARLWRLPVLFVCENNTPGDQRQGPEGGLSRGSLATARLVDLPRALNLESDQIDGRDTAAVADAVAAARARCLAGQGPAFIEALTPGWPGNAGTWPDLVTGRTEIEMAWDQGAVPDDHRQWYGEDDPVLRLARALLADGAATADGLATLDREVSAELERAVAWALASPMPHGAAAASHAFA